MLSGLVVTHRVTKQCLKCQKEMEVSGEAEGTGGLKRHPSPRYINLSNLVGLSKELGSTPSLTPDNSNTVTKLWLSIIRNDNLKATVK